MNEHLTDELLSRLIDGDLSLSAREAALGHLRQCAHCSARQDALVSVAATLTQVLPAHMSSDHVKRIIAGLEEAPTRRRWPTAAIAVTAIGACAAALFTLAGVPVAILSAMAATVDRTPAVPVPLSAGRVLLAAFVVAVGAPLAAYPLARWR